MIGILIIAHGNLGDSLTQCASHVMGAPPPLLLHLGLNKNDDPELVLPKAKKLIEELDQGDGILMLTDMYGATPCNLMAKLLQPGHIEGVAGVSLPMLVRALTYRNGNLAKLVEKAMSGGQEGVVYLDAENFKQLK